MSGRGRNQYSGRGRGHRGGRGGFQRRNNDNRQIEMKFHPYGASGKSSAAALIKSNYCTVTMRNKLKEEDESIDDGNKNKKNQKDPIELLKLISELMHQPGKLKYPYASVTETIAILSTLSSLTQKG